MQSNKSLNDLDIGALVGGSAGDLLPLLRVGDKVMDLMDREFPIGSTPFDNPNLAAIQRENSFQALNDGILEVINTAINYQSRNPLQLIKMYIGLANKAHKAVAAYFKFLSENGYLNNENNKKVLLVNPVVYPLLAPIIPYLQSKGTNVILTDEVGNTPHPNGVHSSPMMPGFLDVDKSNSVTRFALNVLVRASYKAWGKIYPEIRTQLISRIQDVNVPGYYPYAPNSDVSDSLNTQVLDQYQSDLNILSEEDQDLFKSLSSSLERIFNVDIDDALKVFLLMKVHGIFYDTRIAMVPENVEFEGELNEFLNEPDSIKIFVNSSSFQFEKVERLQNRILEIISKLEAKGIKVKFLVNATNKELTDQDSNEKIYYVKNPNYLAKLFHDSRVGVLITTFGQGTAELLKHFASHKNIIIGVPMVDDQEKNIGDFNNARIAAGTPEVISRNWGQITSELLGKLITESKSFQINSEESFSFEWIARKLNVPVVNGAIFILMHLLNMDIPKEMKQEIVAIIDRSYES